MSKVQTDHSFLETKIQLRIDNLPEHDCNVLDCFAGSGLIWNKIKDRLPEKKIRVLSIEQKQIDNRFYLQGDNIKYLSSMDLSRFNVIDLDAYGVPYKQLKIIFSRNLRSGTVIFVTFIQTLYGSLPIEMLVDIGYSRKMIAKCPTLFFKNGLDKLRQYLSLNGISEIKRYSYNNKQKNYLCFTI